jgi:transposase InsO family protein
MGIEQVLTAPRSPWQNPFVERVIGSLRRECLDHVIVLNERSLHRQASGPTGRRRQTGFIRGFFS